MVTSITPAGGPLAGDTSVTINGSGFSGATAVDFGANPASSFGVISDSKMTRTSPAGSGAGGRHREQSTRQQRHLLG